ncbi:hypothetical protein [Paenibacillus sp. FSL P2-0136]|uniref:hypothetical protein n=1 Tax=Paenibacillus sp. FSL P2-0136 TaxID=2975317 RepID=UPI0030D7D095
MSVRKPAVGQGSHDSRGEFMLLRDPRCDGITVAAESQLRQNHSCGGITVAGKSTVTEVSSSA